MAARQSLGSGSKNIPADKRGEFGYGGVWTWTALDAETKLICSWMVGNRDGAAAYDFMKTLRVVSRIAFNSQRTAHAAYLNAVESTFGSNIDYAMLVKICGETAEQRSATASLSALGVSASQSPAVPILSTSAHPTWSANISPCGCTFAASHV